MNARRLLPLLASLVLLVAAADVVRAKEPAADSVAIERTRKTVRMLDDIYKSAVVLITEHYVNDESDLAAGEAAKALFSAVKEKGWHEVRLLDVTGEPYNEENSAKDDFETKAIKQIKEGKTYVDEVVERQGKPYLRAATPIPVVSKKCVMCHPHYDHAKPGQAIGALGYTLPIE